MTPLIELPRVETMAPLQHEGWRRRMETLGITSRKSPFTGEELMVDFDQMSEQSQEEECESVRRFYALLDLLMPQVRLF